MPSISHLNPWDNFHLKKLQDVLIMLLFQNYLLNIILLLFKFYQVRNVILNFSFFYNVGYNLKSIKNLLHSINLKSLKLINFRFILNLLNRSIKKNNLHLLFNSYKITSQEFLTFSNFLFLRQDVLTLDLLYYYLLHPNAKKLDL